MSKYVRMTLVVKLDPVPGAFHTEESAVATVDYLLGDIIPHYKPMIVSSEVFSSHDRSQTADPHILCDGVVMHCTCGKVLPTRKDYMEHYKMEAAGPLPTRGPIDG